MFGGRANIGIWIFLLCISHQLRTTRPQDTEWGGVGALFLQTDSALAYFTNACHYAPVLDVNRFCNWILASGHGVFTSCWVARLHQLCQLTLFYRQSFDQRRVGLEDLE